MSPPQTTYSLFVSFYKVKDGNRLADYILCLKKNFSNPYIDTIFILYEYNGAIPPNSAELPPFLKQENIQIEYVKRTKPRNISYLDFIRYANKVLPENKKFIIANTDIYFDESLGQTIAVPFNNRIFALTRYELDNNSQPTERLPDFEYSQDSWFLQTPFPESDTFDINLGWLNCENTFAYQLDKLGYQVLNISDTLKTYHVHKGNVHDQLSSEGYSYRYTNLPYLYLPYYSIEDVLAADFDYQGYTNIQRRSIEDKLWSLTNEISYLAHRTNYLVGSNKLKVEGDKGAYSGQLIDNLLSIEQKKIEQKFNEYEAQLGKHNSILFLLRKIVKLIIGKFSGA